MTDRPRQSGRQSSARIQKVGDSEELVVQHTSLESSFPPTSWLRECDAINPGYAKRFLDDIVDERQKVTLVEIEHVRHLHFMQKSGQVCGVLVCLAALFTCFSLSYWANDQVTASIVGGGTVVSLVSIFVLGRFVRQKSEQDNEKLVPKAAQKNIKKSG